MSNPLERERVFSTTDADLATFLLLEGIKFINAEMQQNGKSIVVLNFFDEKQNCKDLERIYLNSDFKKFRDMNKYVLKKIHEKLRERV